MHDHYALDDELLDASARYFRSDDNRTPTVEHLAEYYRVRNMAAVIFTVDATTGLEHPGLSSEEIASLAAKHNDVLIPFGSVDPHAADAVVRARRLVTQYGVRGFKFHPSLQAFEPNAVAFYPLYEELEELGVIGLFHTGQTGIGAGLPGGRGIKLRYSDPMLLDDVAADFPAGQIILAHPSVPWVDSAISIATQRRMFTSTCRDGHRSTSRRNWCVGPAPCSSTRCSSDPTIRCLTRTAGWRRSTSSRSRTKFGR